MKGIIYIDFANNRISIVHVNEEELQQEYDGDIYDYAEENMPSNTCEWMMINDDTKLSIDKSIREQIVKKIKGE